jgi:hypothetical protein
MRGTARQIRQAVRPRPSWSRPCRSRPGRSPRWDPRSPDLSASALSPSARSFRFYHRTAPAARLAATRPMLHDPRALHRRCAQRIHSRWWR